ncbi:hypothetical protein Hdeb2414_s0029g00705741 [Helianthus debilis subsp. tardiflorus]
MNFDDVHVDDADIAPIDSVQDVASRAVAEQVNGHIIRFVRMAADYFVSCNMFLVTTKY